MQTEKRGLYIELLCGTVIAGILSFAGFRVLQKIFAERSVYPLMIGLSFAVLTILTLTAIILTERIFHRLGERVDRRDMVRSAQDVKTTALLMLISVVAVGVVAALLQFLYQMEWVHSAPKAPEQFVFLIDNSGSMDTNDSMNMRGDAFRELTNKLPMDVPIAAYSFDNETVEIHPLDSGSDVPFTAEMFQNSPGGGTDIDKACRTALAAVNQNGNRRTRIILLTDGYCQRLSEHPARIASLVRDLTRGNCEVFAIGLGNTDEACLRTLSEGTNGTYYMISDVLALADTIEQAAVQTADTVPRNLVGFRGGFAASSVGLGVFRVLALMLLGTMLALASAMSLYFRSAFRPVLIGGIVESVTASLLTEFLCQGGAEIPAQILLFILLSMTIVVCKYRSLRRSAEDRKRSSLLSSGGTSRSISGAGNTLEDRNLKEVGGEHRIE